MEWAALEALSWTPPQWGYLVDITPLVSHIGMYPPPNGRVFAPFCSENRYRLYPFWSGVGYGFRATTEVYEGIYRFNSK